MKWNLPRVSMQKIIDWKSQFGMVFYVDTGFGKYFFRPLKKKEFDFLLNINKEYDGDVEDALLSMSILYPKFNKKKFDNKYAGEVDFLVRCINKVSGFSGTDDVVRDIELARQSLVSLENQMIIMICKAFPHLKLEDIDHLTYEELIRYLAFSEAILDMKLTIEKPNEQKSGAIDFDAENKGIEGAVPFSKPPTKQPRGDVGK